MWERKLVNIIIVVEQCWKGTKNRVWNLMKIETKVLDALKSYQIAYLLLTMLVIKATTPHPTPVDVNLSAFQWMQTKLMARKCMLVSVYLLLFIRLRFHYVWPHVRRSQLFNAQSSFVFVIPKSRAMKLIQMRYAKSWLSKAHKPKWNEWIQFKQICSVSKRVPAIFTDLRRC